MTAGFVHETQQPPEGGQPQLTRHVSLPAGGAQPALQTRHLSLPLVLSDENGAPGPPPAYPRSSDKVMEPPPTLTAPPPDHTFSEHYMADEDVLSLVSPDVNYSDGGAKAVSSDQPEGLIIFPETKDLMAAYSQLPPATGSSVGSGSGRIHPDQLGFSFSNDAVLAGSPQVGTPGSARLNRSRLPSGSSLPGSGSIHNPGSGGLGMPSSNSSADQDQCIGVGPPDSWDRLSASSRGGSSARNVMHDLPGRTRSASTNMIGEAFESAFKTPEGTRILSTASSVHSGSQSQMMTPPGSSHTRGMHMARRLSNGSAPQSGSSLYGSPLNTGLAGHGASPPATGSRLGTSSHFASPLNTGLGSPAMMGTPRAVMDCDDPAVSSQSGSPTPTPRSLEPAARTDDPPSRLRAPSTPLLGSAQSLSSSASDFQAPRGHSLGPTMSPATALAERKRRQLQDAPVQPSSTGDFFASIQRTLFLSPFAESSAPVAPSRFASSKMPPSEAVINEEDWGEGWEQY